MDKAKLDKANEISKAISMTNRHIENWIEMEKIYANPDPLFQCPYPCIPDVARPLFVEFAQNCGKKLVEEKAQLEAEFASL